MDKYNKRAMTMSGPLPTALPKTIIDLPIVGRAATPIKWPEPLNPHLTGTCGEENNTHSDNDNCNDFSSECRYNGR